MIRFKPISKYELTVFALILILTKKFITSSNATPACLNLKTDTGNYSSTAFLNLPSVSLLDYKKDTIEYFFEILPCMNHTIKVTDIPSGIHFVVVQVHSFVYNVTLGYLTSGKIGQKVVGTNIGLVQVVDGTDTALFHLGNQHVFNVSVLLVVVSYGRNAPIPGGCNMEYEIETSPFLKLNFTSHIIQVDAQPAQIPDVWFSNFNGGLCTPNILNYEMYLLYLPQNDFTEESYFSGIRKMLSVNRIKQNGRKVIAPSGSQKLRRIYNKYYGIGSVYAVIVSIGNLEYSAYVPIHTYGCYLEYNEGTCYNLSFYSLLSGFILGSVGVFLCFFGNKHSRYEMVVVFGLFVSLLLYIVLVNYNLFAFSEQGCALLSIVFGLIFARLFLCVAQKCEIGIVGIAYLIDAVMLSILFASVIFYTPISDFSTLDDKIIYWLLFCFCIFLILLILLCFENIITLDAFASAFVGAYAIILCLEFLALVNSNLRYIIINPVRLATVDNFDLATISPPYQTVDLIMVIIWIVLSVIGICLQPRGSFHQSPIHGQLLNNQNVPSNNIRSNYGSCMTPDINDSVFFSDN